MLKCLPVDLHTVQTVEPLRGFACRTACTSWLEDDLTCFDGNGLRDFAGVDTHLLCRKTGATSISHLVLDGESAEQVATLPIFKNHRRHLACGLPEAKVAARMARIAALRLRRPHPARPGPVQAHASVRRSGDMSAETHFGFLQLPHELQRRVLGELDVEDKCAHSPALRRPSSRHLHSFDNSPLWGSAPCLSASWHTT